MLPSKKKHGPGLKESINLRRPIKFELNLPRIPESSRSNKHDGIYSKDPHSKVVVIQAIRYKMHQKPNSGPRSIEKNASIRSSREFASKSVDLSAYFENNTNNEESA